jgi:1,2-dihydroxy-3-keto-5-methylthiopentene dioxygenase
MAILTIPDLNVQLNNPAEIKQYLNARGVFFDQWQAAVVFDDAASPEEILAAYNHELQPYMEANGYKTADVISINSLTQNYGEIRTKFLSEHIHSEDEVRFFVDGEGHFWFNLEGDEPIFNVLCQAGDLISVPAGTKHWFDAGASNPFVKAIRVFIDTTGWVPEYTHSKIEQQYL